MIFSHSKFRLINMKTIIAVVFYGILTHAFANAAAKIRTCQQVSAMQNFDSSKFFKLTWSLTHAKEEGGSSTLCQKFKFEQESKDKLVIKYGYYTDIDLYTAHCKDSKKIGEGKYSFDCTLQDSKQERGKFKLDFTMIGTDYKKFAVFHRCVKVQEEVTGENILVLKQNKDDNTTDSEIAKILEKQNFSLKNFVSRKSQNCKDVTNL